MVSPYNRKNRHAQKKKVIKLRYSFLTLVLLACLGYVGASAFYNISKTINYQGKIRKMEQVKEQALFNNIRLKEELDNFNSLKSLEAIARNNLKMAGDDEVLVIINKKKEPKPEQVEKKNSFSFFKSFNFEKK